MQTIEELQTDFKAEVVAACLLKEQEFGSIIIDRLGNNQRGHTKDLYGMHERLGHLNTAGQVVLQSFRESIYDAMPEHLFHPPTLGGVGKNVDEIVAEIQLQRKRELEARKFFKPFEQEASYIEMQSLLIELMYEQKSSYNNLLELFTQSWPILGHLPASIALSFIYILPILHQVRGNKEWIERSLTFVTGFKVKIVENDNDKQIDKKQHGFITGASQLGINSSFDGGLYDGITGWDIQVGPIPLELIGDVLPHTAFGDVLQLLSDYFLPSSVFANYIITSEKENDTLLTTDETGAHLGYSFFL